MLIDDRITSYIQSLIPDEDPILTEIRAYAEESFVPVIRPETAAILKTLIELKQAKKILEIGTAIGYSAILMSRCQNVEHITTVENYEPRIEVARKNIKKAGLSEKISLVAGDAGEFLKELDEAFDLVFLDAAKAQYPAYLPDILRVLKTGGVLITDNVMQDGEILESHFTVPKRNRTIHDRMREYLYILTHDEELQTSIVPIGDGISISVKKLT
ncbi:MAG: O-methyltransferase [Lachnospiraceae bacterium]|nr:O-methyltransferase [Lachnospiraceae bacterium]